MTDDVAPTGPFTPRRYAVKWVGADPKYEATYNLVPSVTLYEAETVEEETPCPCGCGCTRTPSRTVFIFFQAPDNVRPANYDTCQRNIYVDYPRDLASEIVNFVESGKEILVAYKEQETRTWVELMTKSMPL